MLTLGELKRAAPLLEARISGHRVQGIVQPDETSIVLTTWGRSGDAPGARRHLLLSGRPETARVSLLPSAPRALPAPPAFAQFLRAHVLGARVGGVRMEGGDRLLAIRLSAEDGEYDLLLSIFGKRSNVYLLEADGKIAAALRPLRQTRSELSVGEVWRPPASVAPRAGEDRFADVPDADYFRAVEEHFSSAERSGDAGAEHRRIGKALGREERRLQRKLAKLEGELHAAQESMDLERQGELLKGALSQVKRGDARAVVRDYETGEEVEIALDPMLSPAENLERIFKRYRKAVRSLTKGGAQEDAVRGLAKEVAALVADFEEIDVGDLEALGVFAERPAVRKILPRVPSRAPTRAKGPRPGSGDRVLGKHVVPARLAPRRYRTAGDLEIWVGRSDAGNDHLTVRLARGRDLFFHLDGAPGSHVILRTGGRKDPPSEAVLDACELAVHFSKFKSASRADVHVVPIANVKKPKGAKPGLVTVHGGRTVHLRRVPKRLERVLDARVED